MTSESLSARRATVTSEAKGPVELTGTPWVIARVAWVLITFAAVALFLRAIPVAYQQFQVVCVSDQQLCQLTPDMVANLRATHLSPGFYAAYLVALNGVTALIYLLLAAFLFWQRSHDRIAMLAAFTFVTFGAAAFTSDVTQSLAMTSQGWRLLIDIMDLLGQMTFVALFCTFPDGRFTPKWTVGLVAAAGSYWFLSLFIPATSDWVNSPAGNLFFVALIVATIAAQVCRYRRVSSGAQRQQTKWVVVGYAVGLGCFVCLVVAGNVWLSSYGASNALVSLAGTTGVYLSILVVPVSIVVAVVRSRLWDIDVLINRTLVYGSLTALLAGVYFGSVVLLQHLTVAVAGHGGGDNPLILVLSTLLIAALFQPLRTRLQRTIDRRFYRSKYDAAKTLARFAATLRSEVDIADLQVHLVNAVEETMQPAHVSLWLRAEDGVLMQGERHTRDFLSSGRRGR